MFLFKLITFSATVLGLSVWFGPVISAMCERLIANTDQSRGSFRDVLGGSIAPLGVLPIVEGGAIDIVDKVANDSEPNQ